MRSHIHSGTQSKAENKLFFFKKKKTKKTVTSKQRERTDENSYLQAAREEGQKQ